MVTLESQQTVKSLVLNTHTVKNYDLIVCLDIALLDPLNDLVVLTENGVGRSHDVIVSVMQIIIIEEYSPLSGPVHRTNL